MCRLDEHDNIHFDNEMDIHMSWNIWICYHLAPQGGGLFIGTLRVWRSHYEITPPTYEKLMETNKYVRTNEMLENGLVYFL